MKNLFKGIYKGKSVFLTGHTGFKGAWLALWLQELGATVHGYALNPEKSKNIIDQITINGKDYRENILDKKTLKNAILEANPDIVFHLAAQPIVKTSYSTPEETFLTNAIGTMNILEILRTENLSAQLVSITTDKVYHNNEWVYGYRETDALGGYDPYSASKACAELILNAYQKSFFNPNTETDILIASARAGNVIGGGDWADYRLMPDIITAAEKGNDLEIRSPKAVRPWQHVLEPLSGYLWLGLQLLTSNKKASSAWNFGPNDENIVTVEELVKEVKKSWNSLEYKITSSNNNEHEAGLLKLDVSKARHLLKWKPVLTFAQTIKITIDWYKSINENGVKTAKERCLEDLNKYIEIAQANQVEWSQN